MGGEKGESGLQRIKERGEQVERESWDKKDREVSVDGKWREKIERESIYKVDKESRD